MISPRSSLTNIYRINIKVKIFKSIKDFKTNGGNEALTVFVGNKLDLSDERVVSSDEAKEMSN